MISHSINVRENMVLNGLFDINIEYRKISRKFSDRNNRNFWQKEIGRSFYI